ncbi:MAG TPA: metal-dependent hydrolase [Prosthecobacter sp.]|nr:metal-dependent hydrolase [Prosthecobacter sp.]
MATVLSHAIAAVALKAAFPAPKVPARLWLLGAVFSMAPDADVVSFQLGIPYADLFGHRGFTHSLFFAGLLALLGTWVACPRRALPVHRGWVWLYLFLATASHGLLDALTDGGHGVAFFAPFDAGRYFFPISPIAVSPIGWSRFFSSGGWQVLVSEAVWIWLPSLGFAAVAWLFRRRRRGASAK